MIEIFKNKIIEFYRERKLFFYIIIIIWLTITVSIGILMGLSQTEKIIPLTPEEENAKALLEIKNDEEKILKGEMLDTKNNLNLEQLEYSSNYVKNRKKRQ